MKKIILKIVGGFIFIVILTCMLTFVYITLNADRLDKELQVNQKKVRQEMLDKKQ
jgi:hypothetical protein